MHRSKELRQRIAHDVGISPPQEPDPYGGIEQNKVTAAKNFIKQSYVLKLLQAIHDDLQRPDTPPPAENPIQPARTFWQRMNPFAQRQPVRPLRQGAVFRLRDDPSQGSRVAHKIFDEMLEENIYPDQFMNACNASFARFQREIADEAGMNRWIEKFFHMVDAADLRALTLQEILNPDNDNYLMYKRAFLYPILQDLTTKEHLLHYLTQRGLFQPANY